MACREGNNEDPVLEDHEEERIGSVYCDNTITSSNAVVTAANLPEAQRLSSHSPVIDGFGATTTSTPSMQREEIVSAVADALAQNMVKAE